MKTDIKNYDLYVRYAYHLYKAGMHEESYIHNMAMAEFASSIGDLDLAERSYQRAIENAAILEHFEDRSNALFQLAGNVYTEWGRYDDAISCYNEVLKIQPTHASAWYERARLNIKGGDREKAAADLKKAIDIGKDDYRIKATKDEYLKTLVKDVSAGSLYIPQRADASIFGDKWISFLDSIRSKKVTPVIGPEACAPWIPLPNEIALSVVMKYTHPFSHGLTAI